MSPAPGRTRTCNLRIRSPTLYPLSYERMSFRRKKWVEEGVRTLDNQIHNLALYQWVEEGVRTLDNQIHNLALYH